MWDSPSHSRPYLLTPNDYNHVCDNMSTSREHSRPDTREPSPERGRSHHPRGPSDVPKKEKKRVGFSGPQDGGSDDRTPDSVIISSPGPAQQRLIPSIGGNGPEPAELHRALTKILITEAEDSEPVSPPGPPGPARPRPALRRNTSYDAPAEREKADLAEKRATERQQRSGVEAKQRAERLAVSVEKSYSQPSSRRGSNDMIGQTLLEETEDEEDHERSRQRAPFGTFDGTSSAIDDGDDASFVRSRPRKRSHVAAENLVRTHTRRARKGMDAPELYRFKREEGPISRPATPTEEQDFIGDYVPRPEKYRGGVLGLVLKLYNQSSSGENSTRGTPIGGTPNASPPPSFPPSREPSQPPSRVTSAPSSPKPSRPASSFFGYHRKEGSKSSLALTELMKSTSTLIAPGSGGMSGGVSEKIKSDPVPAPKKRRSNVFGVASPSKKEKKRDDQIRITKHIAQILSRHRYLVKLCRALMMYGAPTHRLEEYMTMSARVLAIEGQFLYIPGCMIISFDDSSTHTTEVKIVRAPQGLDLGKLRDLHSLYKEVVHDRMGVDEAIVKLDEIINRKLKFNNWLRIPVYGLASACVAPFAFQGRFIDMPIAFILGCLLGFLQLVLAPNNELYANVFEITAAIFTSFLARAFGSIRGGELFCFSALAQSSIALILPGYMVLCSSLELQTHNLVAGSVRMVYAMIYTLFLGYGITIGTAIYGLIDREGAVSDTTCRDPLDRRWHLLFVPAFTLCLCVVNQAKWKQMPVMLVISLAGFIANSYTSDYLQGNTHISNMLGALTVGILANLYSRVGRHFENFWYQFVDWYQRRIAPRFSSASRRRNAEAAASFHASTHQPLSDVESRPGSPTSTIFGDEKPGMSEPRKSVGYGLAAAAMLPAIFVQVPSGLAAGGSLLAGVTSADQITSGLNGTSTNTDPSQNLNTNAFAVLFAVIQVAIGITVGLFLSALIVYPFGKRRSGLLSF